MMETLNLSNISEVCRICFNTNSNMASIFDSENSIKIDKEIYLCFNQALNRDNRLPQSICNSCLEELHISIKFKQKCLHSHKLLNKLIEERNFFKEEVDFEPCQRVDSDNQGSNIHKNTITEKKRSFKKRPSEQSFNTKDEETHSDEIDSSAQNEGKDCIVGPTQKVVEEFLFTNFSDKNKSILDANLQKRLDLNDVSKSEEDRQFIIKCGTCNLECQNRWALKIHTRTHSGERPYKCNLCPKTFVSGSNMKMHNRVAHNTERQVCSECGKSFSCLTYLKRHLVIHSAIKPHECTICKKRFATKSYLKEHIARHKGDKRFFCEMCGAKFISDVNLKQHKIVHGIQNRNFKRHHCTFCDYKTMGRVDLARHIRKHTGEKPFQCPHEGCQAAFAGKASLKLHIRIHTGEKPYNCSECLVKFSRQDKYKNHMLKKHNIIDVSSTDRSKLIIKELKC